MIFQITFSFFLFFLFFLFFFLLFLRFLERESYLVAMESRWSWIAAGECAGFGVLLPREGPDRISVKFGPSELGINQANETTLRELHFSYVTMR